MTEGAVKSYRGTDSEEAVLLLFRRIRESEEEKIAVAAEAAGADDIGKTTARSEHGTIKETANLYVIRHQESIVAGQQPLIATRHMIGTRRKGSDNLYMLTGFFGNPASDNYSTISEVDTGASRLVSRSRTVYGGTPNAAFAMAGSDNRHMLYLYYQSGGDEIAGMLRVGKDKEGIRYSIIKDIFVQGYRENGLSGALTGIERYVSTSYDQSVVVINPKMEVIDKSGVILPDGDVIEMGSKKQKVPTYVMYNNGKLGVSFISVMNRDSAEEECYAARGEAPVIERIIQERPLPSWQAGSDDRMYS